MIFFISVWLNLINISFSNFLLRVSQKNWIKHFGMTFQNYGEKEFVFQSMLL